MSRRPPRYCDDSLRLAGYDYTRPEAYFFIICVKDRYALFGAVQQGRMQLNDYGRIAREESHRTGVLRNHVQLDAFVVMPDHVHGILVLVPSGCGPVDPYGYELTVFAGRDAGPSLQQRNQRKSADKKHPHVAPRSLGVVVRAFKSAVTRRINQHRGTSGGAVWQTRYHDRILRSESEWRAARRYIADNPWRRHGRR